MNFNDMVLFSSCPLGLIQKSQNEVPTLIYSEGLIICSHYQHYVYQKIKSLYIFVFQMDPELILRLGF